MACSCNVVLEKDGDQLARSFDKERSVAWKQGEAAYPTCCEEKVG